MGDTLAEKAYVDAKKNSSDLADITQQVKAIKVLTQAEYDALPASKTTDNTLYLIRG
jgi:hypothetical protein